MAGEWSWDALLSAEPPPRRQEQLALLVERVLEVRHDETVILGEGSARRWTGRLLLPPSEVLETLTPYFAQQGYTALLQEGPTPDEVYVVAAPGVIEPASSRLWLALTLFVITVASTVMVGALGEDAAGRLAWDWANGLMFAGTLLSILLAHELGHFLVSRRLEVQVSYPFFIPLPIPGSLGTMGAVIQMKEPAPNRRALFAIAVAGPLAGLLLAIPLTMLGLSLSEVQPLPPPPYFLEGNNLLYGAMKFLIFGEWLPAGGRDVLLHPIAFAGWAGMLVTMLNLLPAGQLDGGHIVFALLGRRRALMATYVVIAALIGMGFFWSGWWLWALLIYTLARRSAPLLDDVTALTPRQKVLGLLTLLFFILLFTPAPLTIIQ